LDFQNGFFIDDFQCQSGQGWFDGSGEGDASYWANLTSIPFNFIFFNSLPTFAQGQFFTWKSSPFDGQCGNVNGATTPCAVSVFVDQFPDNATMTSGGSATNHGSLEAIGPMHIPLSFHQQWSEGAQPRRLPVLAKEAFLGTLP
jgi:hypothetical protein